MSIGTLLCENAIGTNKQFTKRLFTTWTTTLLGNMTLDHFCHEPGANIPSRAVSKKLLAHKNLHFSPQNAQQCPRNSYS